MAFLVVGKRIEPGDPVLKKMHEYETIFGKIIHPHGPLLGKMLDVCPWLRHLGLDIGKKLNRLLHLESEVWQYIEDFSVNNPEAESMYTVFQEQFKRETNILLQEDARKTIINMFLAGVSTTTTTFYAGINILAHRGNIQNRINEEIQKIQKEKGRNPSLKDRPDMPYTRAVLFELLRYAPTSPLSVPHVNHTKASVKGYDIPAGSVILLLLWDLHHDEKVWDKPYEFCPERFLDKDGDVVPADHIYRKNLMPFGAGTRVCLGESLALSRLFLWLTTLVQRFQIRPAPGNDPSLTDARNYVFEIILRPKPYEVIFENRE